MTLPSRKKHLTTLQSMRSLAKARNARRRQGQLRHQLGSWLLTLLLSAPASSLLAQTPGNWQPQRLPAAPQMQPLTATNAQPAAAPIAVQLRSQPTPNAQPAAPTSPANDDSGVVLRWRTSSRVNQTPAQPATSSGISASFAAAALQATTAEHYGQTPGGSNPLRSSTTAPMQGNASQASFAPRGGQTVGQTVASVARPQSSQVRPAAYQAPSGNFSVLENNQIGDNLQPPSITPSLPQGLPPGITPGSPPSLLPGSDELSMPELPPVPPTQTPPAIQAPPNLSAPQPQPTQPLPGVDDLRLNQPPAQNQDPFQRRQQPNADSPSDQNAQSSLSGDLADPKRPDSLANCESFREQLRKASLQSINLNSAPRYGQGLNDDPETSEKQRLDFAASAKVRQWCDRSGQSLVEGRLVDLVNEQVVLDVNGLRREIPLRDLCDSDLAYVGRAWNLPVTCGSGYDVMAGRSFVPSAMQWKASGLCHKPLYFEEVQLERYGHEVGPVLQPLISTAHFFGNVAVLPYKMGIHPPNECQYALGYYRPGDCAPYMLPPIPLSLRGAAAQAGAVVGAAALVP